MEKWVGGRGKRARDMQEALGTAWKESGEGWMLMLEAHGIEGGCWIKLRRSNTPIRRNLKENRTA